MARSLPGKKEKAVRASRAKPRCSLFEAPLRFWPTLFPGKGTDPKLLIEDWVEQGLRAEKPLSAFDGAPEAAGQSGIDLRFRVSFSGREVGVVFDGMPIEPFARPLFDTYNQIQPVPNYNEGHPILRLAGNPSASWLKDNAQAVFVHIMALVDRTIVNALIRAIKDRKLSVTGVAAGNPLAKPTGINLASVGRSFNLDLANNRIVFTDDGSKLISVQITGPGAEPGKAKSLDEADKPFVEEYRRRLARSGDRERIALSLDIAAKMSGVGSLESKARRLRNRYK